MKKISLLFLLIFSFHTGKAQLFHEDFEVVDSVFSYGNPGWYQNGRISSNFNFCDSSYVSLSDTTYLECLGFDPSFFGYFILTFDQICKIDSNDQAYIEVSNDFGATWSKVTSMNSSYLGFSDFGTRNKFDQFSYTDWVPGNNNAVPLNSWWKHEVIDISQLSAFALDVRIRFVLVDGNNDGANGCSGWYIDNINLYQSTGLSDIEVKSIINPTLTAVAGSAIPVDIKIKNIGGGGNNYSNITVSYSINGNTPVSMLWPDTLQAGDSVTITMPSFIVPFGPYDICAFTDYILNTNPFNDTLCSSFVGSPLINLPYSDDFEGTNPGWFDPDSLINPTIWESGTPSYGLTNSAHSGIRCWDTNLDTSYFGPSNSLLYSPLFNFSTVGNASLSFWQNRNTEPLVDGLRLEYSINGGGWQLLGLANNPLTTNWYTDSAINATTQPGWEGNSGGWIQSFYPLPSALSNQAVVQFRFVFSADNSIHSDGVSIDDFSISFSSCGNTINYSANPGTCGDSVLFNYTATSGIASQHWDLGNGSSSSSVSAQGFYTGGIYTVTLYTVDSTGCAASSVLNYSASNGFAVYAGPDMFTCGAAAQLQAITTVPGNSYTYGWSPVAGLNNPFIFNPQASHTDSLTYTVTVTDTVTGCSATDQVMVSSYSGYNDIITICKGGAVIFDLGPGGLSYLWQTFTDTLGTIFPINISSQAFLATQPGTYQATATFPLCGVVNSVFTVQVDTNCITDVWPGDCNYDQVANNLDFLNIGLAFGTSGSVRPGASLNWTAQPCPDWIYYYAGGINYKHSDCNGSGTVDSFDVQGILQNYGQVHPLKPWIPEVYPQAVPTIYLTASADTLGTSDTLYVAVNLGTASVPVDSIYGIAYSISFESALIDSNYADNDYTTSWLGSTGQNLIGLEKHFLSLGNSDFAQTRTDHFNVINGSGTLAVMTIVTTDNLSGKTLLHLNLHDVVAITHAEHVIPLTVLGDSVTLDPNFTGTGYIEADYDIAIFPNPARSELIIRSKNTQLLKVELKNALGQLIRKIDQKGNTIKVDIRDQPSGILFLSVLTDKGVISKKVQVFR